MPVFSRVALEFFPFLIYCCFFASGYCLCLRHKIKICAQDCSDSVNSFLLLQNDLHGRMSQTYKKNTEANCKVYDLKQNMMKALETLSFLYSFLEKKTGKDMNKEDESYDKVFEELQGAMEKFKDAQRHAEIPQEQLCDRRERYDTDFLEIAGGLVKRNE